MTIRGKARSHCRPQARPLPVGLRICETCGDPRGTAADAAVDTEIEVVDDEHVIGRTRLGG